MYHTVNTHIQLSPNDFIQLWNLLAKIVYISAFKNNNTLKLIYYIFNYLCVHWIIIAAVQKIRSIMYEAESGKSPVPLFIPPPPPSAATSLTIPSSVSFTTKLSSLIYNFLSLFLASVYTGQGVCWIGWSWWKF